MIKNILNEITAPYNFVPLSGWIFKPDWAQEVSQDIPFSDGISGVLSVQVTAHTPLLIGHKHEKATENAHGKVHFFKKGNRYAIPGSTLKGMIRNVLEIASFGKMQLVDEKRLGVRDITGGEHIKGIYSDRMRDQKAGFLRLKKDQSDRDNIAEVVPCDYVHITHDDLKKYLNYSQCLFEQKRSVEEKYNKWYQLSGQKDIGRLPVIKFDVQRQPNQQHVSLAKPRKESGQYEGQLVFTGQISDKCPRNGKTNRFGKYRDFVFYTPPIHQQDPLKVSADFLADFRSIHGEGDEKHKGSWNTYWEKKFYRGEEIPVFYHSIGKDIKSIGLAYMYKLAYEYSIGKTIGHSNPEHRPDLSIPNGGIPFYDLPELLFGIVDNFAIADSTTDSSLKSRVSFGIHLGPSDDDIKPLPSPVTILNGPKPTYFPNYLQQPIAQNNKLASNKKYTTYMDENAEVRGWKRYPVRDKEMVKTTPLTEKQQKKVQVQLFPLPDQVKFKGKIRFHNLKPAELGALLWAITWGSSNGLRHSLGMGKPFGYGQVSLSLLEVELVENTQVHKNKELVSIKLTTSDNLHDFKTKYIKEFKKMMEREYAANAKIKTDWQSSPQIKNLLAMASPTAKLAQSGKLKYMYMGMSIKDNEFVSAKKEGFVLPYYADCQNPTDEEVFGPRKSYAQFQREHSEQREQARERKVAALREAELSELSSFERSVREVEDENSEKKHLILLKALEAGKWEKKEEIQVVAKRVKKILIDGKMWREQPFAKNIKKDTKYQLTLRLKKFLG